MQAAVAVGAVCCLDCHTVSDVRFIGVTGVWTTCIF